MRQRLIAGLLIILVMAGCSTRPEAEPPAITSSSASVTPTPAAALPPKDRQRAWLQGQPCAPPCFLGITPGTTSQTATLALLQSTYPPVEPETLHSTNSDPRHISWLWVPLDKTAGVNAYYYEQPPRLSVAPVNTIISMIASGPDMVRLDEVIAAYGDPSHVLAVAHDYGELGLRYYLSVVYLERGFMMSFYTDGRQKITLAPDLTAAELDFFVPTVEGFDAGVSAFYPVRNPSALLVPWEGFKEFAVYCRESRADSNLKGCS
jgi:hypothetical protein